MLILLYGCTAWTLTKRMEKKLDGDYTIYNKSWRQHPTKQQLYGHLQPIKKTIQVRGHCWRSKDELISNVLLWTPSRGRAKAGWPARTYIQPLCADTGCSPEDLPEAMDDREGWLLFYCFKWNITKTNTGIHNIKYAFINRLISIKSLRLQKDEFAAV